MHYYAMYEGSEIIETPFIKKLQILFLVVR